MGSTKRRGALASETGSRRRRLTAGRTLIALTLTAMVVVSGSVLASSSAQAASAAQIKGAGSGRCIDVPGGAGEGAQLEIWDCNGNPNQAITQSGGAFQVEGKCLDADNQGTTEGTEVIWWGCNGQNNQKWSWSGNAIKNQNSGLCLDVTGAGTANGTLLELWGCNGGSNQSWSTGGSTGGGTTGGGGGSTGGGGSSGGGSGSFSIPNNLGAHDPSRIINDGGKYFFYATSNNLTGWYSTDGKNWKGTPAILPNGIPGDVHNAVPTNDGHNIWAPDVIWNPNSGVFDLYYAVADWNNTARNAIGLVTSPTLNPSASNYHWTDRGVVIARTPSANGYAAIDPAPFFDANGNMWLSLGSGYATTRNTAINIVALNKNSGLRSDNSVHVVQACGCEASYVQYHAGYYYLFWNTGGCCSGTSSTYLIHVARSTNVTGPYSGNRNFKGSSGGVHGPGQIGVISQNGKDFYTYHYYNNGGSAVMGLGTITWSGGWPLS